MMPTIPAAPFCACALSITVCRNVVTWPGAMLRTLEISLSVVDLPSRPTIETSTSTPGNSASTP